jgi:tetratricopeptide (TPR) repeat protein
LTQSRIIGCLLLALFLANTLEAQVNHRHFILSGRIHLSEDRFVEAIQHFNTAIRTRPDNFEAYFLRGVAKYNLSDYRGAADDFTATIERHPLYTRAYHYRGIAHDRLQNFYNAQADFNRALEIDPFNPELHVASGATKMRLNDYEGAIKDYDMALLINPRLSNAYLNRGIAKRFLDQFEEALADMNEAVYNDHFEVDAWLRRGMLLAEMEQYEKALNDFEQALILDDKNPLVYYQRAIAHLKTGDTIAALADYERVNMIDTRNALTYYNRAILYADMGDHEAARVLLDEVIRINPQNIYGHFNRGIVHYQMEQWQDAIHDFSAAIALVPDFVGAWINRSLARKALLDENGSDADYQKAMQIIAAMNPDTGNPDSLYQQYSDPDWYGKIIEFESEFVSGNSRQMQPQYQQIDIIPFHYFKLEYLLKSDNKTLIESNNYMYASIELSSINTQNTGTLRLGLLVGWPKETYPLPYQKDEAIGELDLALTSPTFELLLEAIRQHRMQNHNQALTDYNSVLQSDPTSVYAMLNRGSLRFEMESIRQAEEQYATAITISRNSDQLRPIITKSGQADYSGAMDDFNQAIALHPDFAFGWYNRANVLLHLRKFHQAIDDYSEAIKLEPTMGEAYYNRALTLLYLGETKLACSDLSKAGELGISAAYAVIRRYCGK